MRYECEDANLADNYIEFSDAWSRREIRQFWTHEKTDAEREAWLELVKSKIVDIHLDSLEGEPITEPQQVTEDALDGLDSRLFVWLTTAITKAMSDIVQSGNAIGRRLWDTSGDTASRPQNSSTNG